ncbi:MAG: ferrous iron transport protein B [Xanthomonadales bacterium]|nr:ferrous iron transport protein B [Xanthomonadales bacterium]
MTEAPILRVKPEQISITPRISGRIAVVGTPNSGKSSLFNRLTGLRQRTANFPGVTVEKKIGRLAVAGQALQLSDLPGIYSLSPTSLDERIAVEALLGLMGRSEKPTALLAVVDASRLQQGLYLLRQLLELELPVMVALTMTDVAARKGISVDAEALSRELNGISVFPVVGTTGAGMDALIKALPALTQAKPAPVESAWAELSQLAAEIADKVPSVTRVEVERALVDRHGPLGVEICDLLGSEVTADMDRQATQRLGGEPLLAQEARRGHQWARTLSDRVQSSSPPLKRLGARLEQWFSQPFPATLGFLVVMLVVFQAVFAWATPVMDLIDAGTGAVGGWIEGLLPEGMLTSFLVDGVIAGVGSVVIFLPQILILFLFIIVLEDSGFLARSAFLMDRLMRGLGLSGQSVIPLISSFACAVPAVMATRVIPTRRERLATIMAAPFMTCSARLPVYALLIGAFVPVQQVGWFNLQGLILFGLYLLGIGGGVVTALIVNRLLLTGARSQFSMSLPDFRRPNWRTVLVQLLGRAKVFLRRAGTVIFAVAVVIWALAYFPRADIASPLAAASEEQSNLAAAAQLEQSLLGRAGKLVEPVFEPLGWDWRVSAAVIAGFPAREVVVAVLGTIYAVGDEASEERLSERLKSATWPDGRPVFTLPMVIGLLIFYAWCLQCAATVAVIKRETNSWRWPAFSWLYMTAVGYLGALAAFQLGS